MSSRRDLRGRAVLAVLAVLTFAVVTFVVVASVVLGLGGP